MAPTSSIVVLLENDEATRELYRRELARRFTVIACSTEREALLALHEQLVQAIVVEPVALADDSWGFFDAVRRTEAGRTIVVIVCSILDARRRGLEFGADAYLIKPVTPATLAATLAYLLRKQANQLTGAVNNDR
ncbi:MAG: response regulator [Anaerolineales bacterium]|nr:response regulator [Anaerolineales bacterium]